MTRATKAAAVVRAILVAFLLLLSSTLALAGPKEVKPPPIGYDHARFAPDPDVFRLFHGFALSFDSADDDDDVPGADRLRVPHWVAQEVRKWEPKAKDDPWCLKTGKGPSEWFTDNELRKQDLAPVHDTYTNSGFNRGHMAMRFLVARLGQDAAYNTYTLLNAVPQRPSFNQGIWKNLEYLTGAWAQNYGRIWIIQGPVFADVATAARTQGKKKPGVAIPDALFKVVIREKTAEEKTNAADLDKDAPEVIAFLYPQLGPDYAGPAFEYRHERFLTSFDEIEELTRLDFKLSTNQEVESRVERNRADALWKPSAKNKKNRQCFVKACTGNQKKREDAADPSALCRP